MSKVKKQERPVILWKNKVQMAIWEIIVKSEIEVGFWSNAKFDTFPYLTATSAVFPQMPGISFVPSLVSFNLVSKKFTRDHGYYAAIIMKLVNTYDLTMKDYYRLAVFAESFVTIDYRDDNNSYRRSQVVDFNIKDRNITDDYKDTLAKEIAYFRNLGIDMEKVPGVLKDNPYSSRDVAVTLKDMSEVLRTKVDLQKVLELSKS
jgi:hypothetical protein